MVRKKPYTPEELEKRRLWAREYNARPEVKAKKAAYQKRPEKIQLRKDYYNRPEVKQRYKDRRDDEAHRAYCKQWRQSENGKRKLKEHGLRQRGFTLELWETLMQIQGGVCAVCQREFAADYRKIHADHCHDEMLPRGLLCQECNLAEGLIRKAGMVPEEFGRRMSAYLNDPSASRLLTPATNPKRKN